MDKLICPKCGYDGTSDELENEVLFYLLETTQVYRLIDGVAGGVLRVDSLYHLFNDETGEQSILCRKCGHEFPVPAYLEVEYR